MNKEINKRKVREGVVRSNKMQKTVSVVVSRTVRHPVGKIIKRKKTYYAHFEGPQLEVGQAVRIEETRPLSKLKRWRVIEVIS